MKTPEPWECEGKEYTLDEINAFIKHLRSVIRTEIKKVFGEGGWKSRDYPIEVYIGNCLTHRVSRPYWPRKDNLLETQEEILEEFRCLGIYGLSKDSEKLASLLLLDLDQKKKEKEKEEKLERKRKNLCPICGAPAKTVCKCPRKDSECKNGHQWHYCVKHHTLIAGKSDHSIKTYECICPKE